jgi:hypothetical protein
MKFFRSAHIAFFIAIACLLSAAPAEARGGGRFLGSLLSRGAVAAATHSGSSSSAGAKSYTADVLTVAQLAQCIRKAGKLDGDSERLEANRSAVTQAEAAVESSKAEIDNRRARVDQRSRASVNAFNAMIDRHNSLVENAKARQAGFNSEIDAHNTEVGAYNAECARKYYADDLAAAQKLAEAN